MGAILAILYLNGCLCSNAVRLRHPAEHDDDTDFDAEDC
jgi:hypothetical protein